ncbi:hypothetical protein Prudu_001958 [Prunus dulcis]|uniref:Uncharacterized protein n=1 Tax=Prunus dulcis TaxID=3755 RepID=A0A4Y1QPN5_PRUDU|nr:hypothetical protein Prudu_001958 [Prunus dulcis]
MAKTISALSNKTGQMIFVSTMSLKFMDIGQMKCSSSYGKPPWIFKGRYTLGGFFLANYDDSPAGVFDESLTGPRLFSPSQLVVIAGLVWSPPTSCACDIVKGWAAKVLVNSVEACDHGRKSLLAGSGASKSRCETITAVSGKSKSKNIGFLNAIGMNAVFCEPRDCMDVQVTEINDPTFSSFCLIKSSMFLITSLVMAVPASNIGNWMGPAIKMSLPSFSGRTEYYPNLLKYSCQIECRVRAVHPAKVSGPPSMPKSEAEQSSEIHHAIEEFMDNSKNLCVAVMSSKPILALKFSCMKMQVEAPVVVPNSFNNSLATS